ncbi:hypothetical protein [Flavobacterium sp.]|uniref:hypothetical protein n=1 Tax=Flavobacterium sp. TaxID=239 RepID=UPI0037C172A9
MKVEIADHILCEIESEITTNNSSFEESCKLVFERWEPELRESKKWLLGLENSFPKIVVKSLFNKVLFHYSFVLLTVLLVGILLALKSEIHFSDRMLSIFKSALVFFGIVYFLLRRNMNKTKVVTTYSFQFEYFYFPILLVFVYLFILKQSFVQLSLLLFFVVNLPFAFYFYYKHFQMVKKFSKV